MFFCYSSTQCIVSHCLCFCFLWDLSQFVRICSAEEHTLCKAFFVQLYSLLYAWSSNRCNGTIRTNSRAKNKNTIFLLHSFCRWKKNINVMLLNYLCILTPFLSQYCLTGH